VTAVSSEWSNFTRKPPAAWVVKRCDMLGCKPQFLPDTYGVEYGPSERECQHCHRYILPGTDEPFRSPEEITAWMRRKRAFELLGESRMEPGTTWGFYDEAGELTAILRCQRYPDSFSDDQIEFTPAVEGMGESRTLTVEEVVNLGAADRLRHIYSKRVKARFGHCWPRFDEL
jgi:hypothetical protein